MSFILSLLLSTLAIGGTAYGVSKYAQKHPEDFQKLAKSLFGGYFGTNLTGAQEQANLFSASERAAAQDWQEQMYNKYQSPAAQIKQYQDAGINPALMYQGGASFQPVGSSSGAQSVSPGSPDLPNGSGLLSLLRTALDASLTKRRLNQEKELESRRLDIEEQRLGIERDLLPSRIQGNLARAYRDMTSGNLNEIDAETRSQMNMGRLAQMYADINLKDVQGRLAESGISVNEAKAGLIAAQTINEQIQNSYGDKYWQAVINFNNAQTAKNYKEIEKYGAEIKNMELAATGIVLNNGILGHAFEQAGIETDMLRFDKEHQSADKVWQRVGQVAGAVGSVVGAAGSAMSGGASIGRAATYAKRFSAITP